MGSAISSMAAVDFSLAKIGLTQASVIGPDAATLTAV